MRSLTTLSLRDTRKLAAVLSAALLIVLPIAGQSGKIPSNPRKTSSAAARNSVRPKLVVVLVVDQMRGDYVDKFQYQWTGGLKRLINEGAWFRDAAYPYASTETCVGHSTISTGAFPAAHGMVTNEWWDREQQKNVTCTSDSNVKNIAYGSATVPAGTTTEAAPLPGAAAAPGDSAAKMLIPSFAEELKFQTGEGTRIVTMSLKARAAITMAGHQGDAVTWFDGLTGSWITSSAYPQASFVAEFVKAHPVAADYGKTWSLLFPASAYFYDRVAFGAGPPAGYGNEFPHILHGNPPSKTADPSFYFQWSTSPYAETYLEQLAEAAIDNLHMGKGLATDFLGISFSSVDYVGHTFGPRSWEVQDELARLDRDLATFFTHLDKSVGRGNYVVALSADHGVAPVPEDLRKTGIDAGRLNIAEVKIHIEKALEPFHYPKSPVAEVGGADVYFAPGVYSKLKTDATAMQAVFDAVRSVPGVAHIYSAEEMEARPATQDSLRAAEAAGFMKSRSGDLIIVPKPYWIWDYSAPGQPSRGGTSHGTPYYYDQKVPVILMGAGIRPGKYYEAATPADIAPTLAALCGITLATRDGRALREALDQPHSH
ncbi:MAG: alkaline phosphatase family protein [Acidobacteriota bacterium]|nr:alkaline phosphatase family protein [Acidobacteriota bacterium]